MNIAVERFPGGDSILDRVFERSGPLSRPATSDGIHEWLQETPAVEEPWPSRDVLRESLREGVAYALVRHTSGPSATIRLRQNIYDMRRAAWQVLCPLRPDAVVLDFGCGLGAVSRSVARNVGSVVGLDASYERLMVHAAVNREEDVRNVELVCGNHETLSDIKDDSFDGLILNGVLKRLPEWIPGPPELVHVEFLRACRRILKPGGWLYLGTENRWGFRSLSGKTIEEPQLWFPNLLPRWMASAYSRLVRGKCYRSYTYGPGATRRLLSRAGFERTAIYAPLPDYREYEALVPFETSEFSAADVAKCLGICKSWKRRLVQSGPFFRRFVPCLSIVGRDSDTPVPEWFADGGAADAHVTKIYTKFDQAAIWFRSRGGDHWIREVALSREATEKLRRIGQLSEALRASDFCPSVLRDWNVRFSSSLSWADRRVVSGSDLASVSPEERERCVDLVFRELRRIHAAGQRVGWKPRSITELFAEFAPNAERDVPIPLLEQIHSVLRKLESSCPRTCVLMHGDVKPANVIVGEGGVELIDWEWSRVVDHIGYDVLKFAWYRRDNPHGPEFRADNTVVEKRLDDAEARRFFDEVHPKGDWKTSVLNYWATRLARLIGFFRHGGMPLDWNERVIEPWTESLCRVVEPRRGGTRLKPFHRQTFGTPESP